MNDNATHVTVDQAWRYPDSHVYWVNMNTPTGSLSTECSAKALRSFAAFRRAVCDDCGEVCNPAYDSPLAWEHAVSAAKLRGFD